MNCCEIETPINASDKTGVIIFVDTKSVVRGTELELGDLGGNSTKDY